jgi:hypothetical protein
MKRINRIRKKDMLSFGWSEPIRKIIMFDFSFGFNLKLKQFNKITEYMTNEMFAVD